ncbi:MAG TPA: hypothetical protein V6C86_20640 [Oculatellaceae cyanobacterium]
MEKLIAFIRNLFASASVRAANTALETDRRNTNKISVAEQLLRDLQAQRVEDAKASAAALEIALGNAHDDAERAEIRRAAEVKAQSDTTARVIKDLEDAIANARRKGSEKLEKIATRHGKQRDHEKADEKTASDALDVIRKAAGTTAE